MNVVSQRDKLIIKQLNKGLSYVSIGKSFDLSKQRIHQIAGAHGLDTKIKDSRRNNKALFMKIKAELNNGLSTAQIEKKLKISRAQIYYIIKSVTGKSIIRKTINKLAKVK